LFFLVGLTIKEKNQKASDTHADVRAGDSAGDADGSVDKVKSDEVDESFIDNEDDNEDEVIVNKSTREEAESTPASAMYLVTTNPIAVVDVSKQYLPIKAGITSEPQTQLGYRFVFLMIKHSFSLNIFSSFRYGTVFGGHSNTVIFRQDISESVLNGWHSNHHSVAPQLEQIFFSVVSILFIDIVNIYSMF
jgi:hypothetical protein